MPSNNITVDGEERISDRKAFKVTWGSYFSNLGLRYWHLPKVPTTYTMTKVRVLRNSLYGLGNIRKRGTFSNENKGVSCAIQTDYK
mgnify:CR=1 FL=1